MKTSVLTGVAVLSMMVAVSCAESVSGLTTVYRQASEPVKAEDDPNLAPIPTPEPEQESVIVMQTKEATRRPTSNNAVKPVRFCPERFDGKSAFPTTGICLRGKRVYAELDPNQPGLHTWLKPGRYSGYALGSWCSFTVGENCEVSK